MTQILFALTLLAAQAGAPPSSGDFRWTRTLAPGQTIEIRIINGSIRTIASEDGAIHVDARRTGAADTPIDVMEHERGVTICASECSSLGRQANLRGDDRRVDFIVRVPANVGFSGSAIAGDIEISGLSSEVRVATISGNVRVQLAAGENAEFRANTISGTIDADPPLGLRDDPPAFLFGDGPAGGASRPGPRIVHATIGSGGRELLVNTISGNILLRQR